MAFTKSAAKELAPLGIRVNAVAPGIVKTERFSELYEESGEKIDTRIQKIALGRLGTPEDVAADPFEDELPEELPLDEEAAPFP